MNKSNRHFKGLGEVSIRVMELDAMHKFCEEVIGIEVATHRVLRRVGREFCVLQDRRRLWRTYTESRPL